MTNSLCTYSAWSVDILHTDYQWWRTTTSYLISSSPWGRFYKHGLTLIPAWISNYIHYKVWDEIIYPFLNCNGATVEVEEWISNFIPHFTGACDYLSMLGFKLNHVSKSGHWYPYLAEVWLLAQQMCTRCSSHVGTAQMMWWLRGSWWVCRAPWCCPKMRPAASWHTGCPSGSHGPQPDHKWLPL